MRVLLLDIDGCLNLEYPSIIINKNLPLIKKNPYGRKVWDLFEASTKNLKAKPQFLPYYYRNEFAKAFDYIYVVTARLEKWRPQTEKWLSKWGFKYDWLYMRPNNKISMESFRLKEYLIKTHILPKHKNAQICACDDDLSICYMYERNKITAYQTPIDWPILVRDFKLQPPVLNQDEERLLEHYVIKESKKGKTLKSLSEELGYNYRSLRTLKDKLEKEGQLTETKQQKYKRIDIDQFKHLDTEASAYFAGFAASDANIGVAGSNSVISWNQSVEDEDHLKELKQRIGAEQEVKTTASKSKFSIKQPSLINLLVYRWGIDPARHKMQFPKKIPEKTVHHFLRGVYDGDSFFYINEKSPDGPQFVLWSPSSDFIHGISSLYKKLKISHRVIKKRASATNPRMVMLVVPNKDADKLYKFLYKDSTIFLDRKRSTIEKFLNIK